MDGREGLPQNLEELTKAVRSLARIDAGSTVGRPFHVFQGLSAKAWAYAERANAEQGRVGGAAWAGRIAQELQSMDTELDTSPKVADEVKLRPEGHKRYDDANPDPRFWHKHE